MEAERTPSNEKSCQTEDPCHEATVPGPDQASRTPVDSTEPRDPPLLQRPMKTSKSGIQQIIECFRSGTTQLKHILLKEVDTIFECKLCRSLFRGLPNLFRHKEFYCCSKRPHPDEHLGDGKRSLSGKELLDVMYPPPDRQDYGVRLEPIEGNQNAVFQHLVKEDELEAAFSGDSSNHSADGWKPPQLQRQGHDTDGEEGGEIKEHVSEQDEGEGGVKLKESEEQESEWCEDMDELVISRGTDGVTMMCCLCGKDFNSRGSVRRHCHEMHKRWLEELRKFIESQTVPISLLSVVKDRQTGQVYPPGPEGTRCPFCFKTLANEASFCSHFEEVHQGLCHKGTTPVQLESTTTPHKPPFPAPKAPSTHPQFSLDTCQCLLCKRTYSTQARLQRHMRFVHKIRTSRSPSSDSSDAQKPQDPPDTPDSPQADHKHLKRPREEDVDAPLTRKPRLSVGFDFRQLFCKLCKRQFSSRQNLNKHIELHTDNGSDIFIKFYRCTLCRYESRRKRDVLRHISVVHKKNSAYLAKILPALETQSVKKPAEVVLGGLEKSSHVKEEVNGCHRPAPSRGSRRAECSTTSPPVVVAQGPRPPSPPVTRRSHSPCVQNSHGSVKTEEAQCRTKVQVTKNFALHACDICGRAFAKRVYLDSHKRSHRNAASSEGRMMGMSTRSKSLLGSF
ncbi:zinc finger protein 800b isoform X2 [Hoplias malabaricus]